MPAPIAPAVSEAARQDYVEGKGSVREIAERHGMSEHTLRARANGQGWVRAREDYILNQRNIHESKGAIAAIVPQLPIGPEYFLAHGQRLYRQVETIGDQVDSLDSAIGSLDPAKDTKAVCALIASKISLLDAWKDLQGIAKVAPRKLREKAVSARSHAIPIETEPDVQPEQHKNEEPLDLPSQHLSEPTSSDLPV